MTSLWSRLRRSALATFSAFLRLLERSFGAGWGVRNLGSVGDPDTTDNRMRVHRLAASFGCALAATAVIVSGLNIATGRGAGEYHPVLVMLIAGGGGLGALFVFPHAHRLPIWFVHVGASGVVTFLFLTAMVAGEFSTFALMAYIPGVTVVAMIVRLRPLLVNILLVGVASGVVLATQPGNNAPVARWLVLMSVACISAGAAGYLVTRVSILAQREHEARTDAEYARAELEVASGHKSAFLANMSHELRTPLNAIIGFSDVLDQELAGSLTDKQREYVDDIRGSGHHLLSLINDVLDLAKVEAGRYELEVRPFALADLLTEGLRLVRDRAEASGVTLSLALDPALDTVEGDERKVRQIVLNLLSNAVKFTPSGGRVELAAVSSNGAIEISVRDSGVGISPEDHGRIFEEFERTDFASSEEGTGLGLALARRFVDLHGGRIWVESEPGSGSTFRFTLPSLHHPFGDRTLPDSRQPR
jgi:signal transduction histidine kinase